jgi:glutamate synthase domain-containing protein 1
MLEHYKELYLPGLNAFEQAVNDGLDTLCGAAQMGGFMAISAQHKLKALKIMSADDRLKMYQQALAEEDLNAAVGKINQDFNNRTSVHGPSGGFVMEFGTTWATDPIDPKSLRRSRSR